MIAATFGSMVAGQALSFTPDYFSAKVSAGRLFKLFDRQSDIDVNDEKGEKEVLINFSLTVNDLISSPSSYFKFRELGRAVNIKMSKFIAVIFLIAFINEINV